MICPRRQIQMRHNLGEVTCVNRPQGVNHQLCYGRKTVRFSMDISPNLAFIKYRLAKLGRTNREGYFGGEFVPS